MPANQSESGRRREYGYFFEEGTDRVYNACDEEGGWLLVEDDGQFSKFIKEAKRKVAEGRQTLWFRAGSVEIGDLEITEHTEIYHEEREQWLKAEEIDVLDDGTPVIQFKIKGTWPRLHMTLNGDELQELYEDGVLTSKAAVNERAENLLEDLREANS